MPWPPTIPPTNRTDATVMASTHPSDHNQLGLALADLRDNLTRCIVYSGVDNPAAGSVVGAHNAVLMSVTLTKSTLVLIEGQLGLAWAAAFTTNDVAGIDIFLNGGVAVSSCHTIPIGSGTGMQCIRIAHVTTLAAGTHTCNIRASRVAGTSNLFVSAVGYGRITDLGAPVVS